MPINISFNDYDTVCYSNQHNIIELIKNSVGISVEINIQSSAIQQIQADIPEILQALKDLEDYINGGEPGDISYEIRSLKAVTEKLGQDLVNLEYGALGVLDTPIWQQIIDLERRVTALEGG